MQECICGRCLEDSKDSRFFIHCEACELYGTNEEFENDANHEICNSCFADWEREKEIQMQVLKERIKLEIARADGK